VCSSDHIRFTLSNALRALFLGLTGGRLARVPDGAETARYYRQLSRLSAALALCADAAMLTLGGALKRKERISARLGDVLSQLYLCSATLKRFEDDGRPEADLPLLHWSMQDALYRAQQALDGLFDNFPNRVLAALLRRLVFPLGKPYAEPRDRLGHEVASLLMQPGAARDRLTGGIYAPRDRTEAVGKLELAFEAAIACEPIEVKLRAAVKNGQLRARKDAELINDALANGVIDTGEAATLARAVTLRRDAIMVDDFAADFGMVAREQIAHPQSSARKSA